MENRKLEISLYFSMVVVGLTSGLLALSKTQNYAMGDQETIALYLIIAMPVFIGVVFGILFKESPFARALGALVVYLLATAPLLGEGLICLVMYSPFAVVFTLLATWITRYCRQRAQKTASKTIVSLILLATPGTLAILDPYLTPEREPVVITDVVTVKLSQQEVWQRIAHTHFSYQVSDVPFLIRTLMPTPQSITGLGADLGDQRVIDFHNGTITAKITKSNAPLFFEFSFEVKSRGPEFFDRWVNFETSSFEFVPVSAKETKVIHRTVYRPRVFPRWYFAPVENYLAHQTQGFMMEKFFSDETAASIPRLTSK